MGASFCSSCGPVDMAAVPVPQEVTISPDRFEAHWRDIKRLCLFFALLLFSTFILGLTTQANSSPWPGEIADAIDAVIVLVFAAWRYKDLLPLLRIPSLGARSILELAGLGLAFIAVISGYFAVLDYAGVPIIRFADLYRQFHWPVWAMFLSISVMPAIFEELAFRGVIQSTLTNLLGEREAWLIQAALFSGLHLMPIIFPIHFLMGLCFGYMRLRSKSLYPGMLLHGVWNALVLCEELYC